MFKRFSAGFAAGYVFGARAGEKRYKQITHVVERALELPMVSDLADRATEIVNADHGRDLIESIRDRVTAAWPRGDHDRAEADDADEEDDEDDDHERDRFDDSDDDDYEEDDDRGERDQSEDAEDGYEEDDDRGERDQSEDADDEDYDEDDDRGERDQFEDAGDEDDDSRGRGSSREHRGRRQSHRPSRSGSSGRNGSSRRGIRALAGAAIERGRLT